MAGFLRLGCDPVLLLASASPARRRLLLQAAIPHRVQVSGFEEDSLQEADPARLALKLAEAKARAVAAGHPGPWRQANPQAVDPAIHAASPTADQPPEPAVCDLLLGCDSVLSLDGQTFGKPRDRAEAIARWQRMAGRWAELHTGHCLLLAPGPATPGGGLRLATVTTRLRFAALDQAAIERYVASGEPLGCAGGFALEGQGSLVVDRLEGCWSNVIGLSLPWLRQQLPALLPPG